PASTCWSSRSRGGSRTQGQYPVRLESPPVRHHHRGMPAHACTDPKHHVHDGPAFVAAVELACRERGLRLTPIRAHVLGLIAEAEQPIKAYDLLDRVREGDGPGAAGPPTVYRALDFLLANGFIHKLQSVN